jgi:membrane fusion protein (multidrug efflux system)
MPVAVLEARVQTVPSTIEVVGTLEGMREVEVRARVSGVLHKQLFREGEAVRAGSALYRIERAPYEIAQDAARAAVTQQEARVEQARRENTRLAALIAERAISQREADDAASALKTAEAALAAARAQLRDAQLSLGYTQVTAPIGGLAQRSLRSEGALVSPADPTPLTTLVQTDPIRVRFALSEDEAQAIRAAARNGGAQVRLLGDDGRPAGAPGRLDFAGATVDARLGTVAMRAELPNPEGRWLPGQFVRVQVATGTQQGVLVPQAAVMSGEQGRFVWVIGADGTAQPRPVQTGSWLGPDWVLRGGLAGGERVIVDNLMKLRPGAPVRAKAPDGPAGAAAPAGAGAPGAAGDLPAAGSAPDASSTPAAGASAAAPASSQAASR